MEALNWMDPDLVETPRDSPALQQAPAPDAKKYIHLHLYSFLIYFTLLHLFFIVTFVVRHVDALSQNVVVYLNGFCVL